VRLARRAITSNGELSGWLPWRLWQPGPSHSSPGRPATQRTPRSTLTTALSSFPRPIKPDSFREIRSWSSRLAVRMPAVQPCPRRTDAMKWSQRTALERVLLATWSVLEGQMESWQMTPRPLIENVANSSSGRTAVAAILCVLIEAQMRGQCARYLLCGLFPAAQGRPPLSCGGP
jgi:hypothetical protein